MLIFGGTLNGNFGPVLDDLLIAKYDRINHLLTVRPAREEADSAEERPGARRGHSFTAASAPAFESARLAACAVVLGGWGDGEVEMVPHLVTKGSDDAFAWRALEVSGSPPESGTTCAAHFGFDA